MCVLPARMFVHHMPAWWPQKPEDSVSSLGSGVIDSCKPLWGYKELNLGLPQEHQVLLTTEHRAISPAPNTVF